MTASQLKKVETLLNKREQELEMLALQRASILDSLPANVTVLDNVGMIVFVNRPWRQFANENGFCGSAYGCGDNYLAICDAANGDNAEEAASVARAIRDVLAGRLSHFEIEYPCHAPTEQRWFRCMITPILGGAVIMHLNITEQKIAALKSLQAQKLIADVSRQKSSFLANMSHELRTPLNAIIGFSELMVKAAFGPLPPRYGEYAEHIHSAGSHLLEVINDVLDLSKIESGHMTLEPEPLVLSTVIARIFSFFENMAAGKDIDLSWAVADDLIVMADELRLRQVLLNLLSNALKFTPEGGQVRLESRRAGNGDIAISVCDTGIGMSEDEIKVALQPFGQILTYHTRQDVGTGLGLPLAKQLIELQGGTFSVIGKPGQGVRIEMTLPAVKAS